MKIIKGIKIGGLQQKIFNLMLIFILLLVGAPMWPCPSGSSGA